MHRKLKNLLHGATGQSGLVVVVFLDIRGFSEWMTDSTRSALYLKSAYTRILDDFFPTASFFKPTGDGLLVVLAHDESEANLRAVVQDAVEKSVDLVAAFPSLTAGDPLINFSVPQQLGIGIARGTATRLVSRGQTLDYSGHPLNLAARLMDLARPSGVVFDSTLEIELLQPATVTKFNEEQVFVKGLSERTSMTVHVLTDMVEVPQFNRYPIGRYKQRLVPLGGMPFKRLKERELFHHTLHEEPADREQVQVHIRYPDKRPSGRKHPGLKRTATYPATFRNFAGKMVAELDYRPVVAQFVEWGVKDGWEVEVMVEYPVRDMGT